MSDIYEKYPCWIPAISISFSLIIYLIGSYIISYIGLIFVIIYLAYCFTLELNVMINHCSCCYYHGKNCGIGKGKISGLITKKKDPKKFIDKKITWVQMIPDFLVFIIPTIVGVYLLIQNFSLIILVLIIILFILSSAGNAFIRGKLVCNSCKQKQLGCPAIELFEKNNKEKK